MSSFLPAGCVVRARHKASCYGSRTSGYRSNEPTGLCTVTSAACLDMVTKRNQCHGRHEARNVHERSSSSRWLSTTTSEHLGRCRHLLYPAILVLSSSYPCLSTSRESRFIVRNLVLWRSRSTRHIVRASLSSPSRIHHRNAIIGVCCKYSPQASFQVLSLCV